MGVWVGPGVCGGWLYSMGGAEGGGEAPFTDISVYGSILTDPQSVRRTHPISISGIWAKCGTAD